MQNSRGEFKEFPTGRLPPNAKITMQNPSEQLRQTVQKSHYKSPKSHRKAWKNMKRKGTTNPPIIHIKIHRNILGKNIQKTETQKLQSQNQKKYLKKPTILKEKPQANPLKCKAKSNRTTQKNITE